MLYLKNFGFVNFVCVLCFKFYNTYPKEYISLRGIEGGLIKGINNQPPNNHCLNELRFGSTRFTAPTL